MKYKISYDENITRWEDALPLGNGEMGCLIWGSPDQLRFSLDRTDVWDTTVPYGTESKEFTYGNLVRLAREGNIKKIREIFDEPYEHPTPTKLPVGKIILHLSGVSNYRSCLRLWDGQAFLYSGKDTEPQIRSLMHATRRIGMISVNRPWGSFEVELKAPEFGRKLSGEETYGRPASGKEKNISKGSLKQLMYQEPQWKQESCKEGRNLMYFRQRISKEFAYGVVMGVKSCGGCTEIFYRVVTSGDGRSAFQKASEEIRQLMDLGYDGLLNEHIRWWQEFWDASSICLPDKFMERNWYLSNYLLASCSREGYYPMPLQGVWTADENALPPWKGDYHNDLNTQMSYYHYLKANHLSQGRCFVDFLWARREAGREFAQRFYGTGGLCLPAVMTINGKPLGGWPMYSLSPTNQIWLCKAFDDFYRYTGDEHFLSDRAYPYFKETAECIGGLLTEGPDGYLHLPISSSPEIHDDEITSFLTPDSNYDLTLLHYLYERLAAYADQLLLQEADGDMQLAGERDEWRRIRNRLAPLAVDERNVLMLARDEMLKESHRHFSHAQGIHPMRLMKYDSPENCRIIEATIRDLEVLGTDMWVGFSFCWMAELYAVAHKGEKAAEQLRIFWECFCSSNGFHLNGDQKKRGHSTFVYHPFTLEANMCAADALQEMLLYGENGILEVFPAVPAEWLEQGVAFERLRSENGVLVTSGIKNGRLYQLMLETDHPVRVKLKGWDQTGQRREDAVFSVMLQPGKNYFL